MTNTRATETSARDLLAVLADVSNDDVELVLNTKQLSSAELAAASPKLLLAAMFLSRSEVSGYSEYYEEFGKNIIAENPRIAHFSVDETADVVSAYLISFLARLDQLKADLFEEEDDKSDVRKWVSFRKPTIRSITQDVLRHISTSETSTLTSEIKEAASPGRYLIRFLQFYDPATWTCKQLLFRANLGQAPQTTALNRRHFIWTPEVWLFLVHSKTHQWEDPEVFAKWLLDEHRSVEHDRLVNTKTGHCLPLSEAARETFRCLIVGLLDALLPLRAEQFEAGTKDKRQLDCQLATAQYVLIGLHRKTYHGLWSKEYNKPPYDDITRLITPTKELPTPKAAEHPFWVQEELRGIYGLLRSAK